MDAGPIYFKFPSSVVESGVWAKLSSSAKTLYPVLLKFSGGDFKPVWPGTLLLLKLTGFKSKKSLQKARKELQEAGLLDFIPGTGRTPTRYYFRFPPPQGATKTPPRGRQNTPQGDSLKTSLGEAKTPQNYINIQIDQPIYKNYDSLFKKIDEAIHLFLNTYANNQTNSQKLSHSSSYGKREFIQELVQKYGELETGEAIKIAISKGKNGDIRYLEGILRNRKNKQNPPKRELKELQEVAALFPAHLQKIVLQAKYRYSYNGIKYFILPYTQNIKEFMEIWEQIKKDYPIVFIYASVSRSS